MVNDALRRVMLAAEGAGELEGEDVCHGRAEHPACGDVLELSLRLDDRRRLIDLAWRADGCPATIAVAALARGAMLGATAADAIARLHARLAELGGLAVHERHAQKLLQRAFAAAIGAGRDADPRRPRAGDRPS